MKLALFTLGVLFTTTVQAQVSPLAVVVHSEDPDLHPSNACGDDSEDAYLAEELAIVMGNPPMVDDDGRRLTNCYVYCRYFPSPVWCWAYVPFCNGFYGRRALSKEQFVSDHSVECAKTVLKLEESLQKLADFASTDSCRSALLDKKDYECFRIKEEE